ncbi:histidine kinase dimerization/phosphoacceptor domain -containing protein [Maridesulfovibrio hydrothermalis]|uniref:histidine kinase n=1 Tax=Maridesulfovibrio hydrothermalis AM13 = DSM 14728 TaxID=1121451 RepID=L0RDU6_9BACT|nr:histidine kinase dimerization/phosphoacceptor domain -containing protein [Maridesulfovibrio hydrothermalis]CCO24943.1 protein of unknown function [Maridesulfovibrio hydrothermalis AM13 = DSM 14728]
MNTTYGFTKGSLENELATARAKVAALETQLCSFSGAENGAAGKEIAYTPFNDFTEIVENIDQGVLVFDRNLDINFINQSARCLLQCDQDDFDAYSFFESMPASMQEELKAGVLEQGHLEGIESFKCEFMLGSGLVKKILFKCIPVFDAESKYNGVQILITDVTDVTVLRQTLERSEKLYQALFDGAGDAIFIQDSSGVFIDANKAACDRLGYTREQFLKLNSDDIRAANSCNIFNIISKRACDGEPFVETVHCIKDGEHFEVEINSRKVCVNGENKILTIARDISERVQADNRSELYRKRLRALYEMSHMNETSIPAFFEYAIRKCIELSGSELGFIAELEGSGSESGFNNWTSMDRGGTLDTVLQPRKLSSCGLWAGAVTQRRAVFDNDIAPQDCMYPFPDGRISNYLAIPVLDGGKVVMVALLANNRSGYAEDCIRNIGLLVDGMWNMVCRRKAELQIRNSLREKETLLKEVHHRVKNNMQVICSLLNLQTDYIKDPQDLLLIKHSIDRVRSMAYVHEQLYRSDDLSSIDFGQYISGLGRSLISSYGAADRVSFLTELDSVGLPVEQALPCGLIVNELITNAITHAFPDGSSREENKISVDLVLDDGRVTMTVADNGIGISGGLERTGSLGHILVETLVQQIDGTMKISSGNGARFELVFKLK